MTSGLEGSIQDDLNNIPLADDDPQVIIGDEEIVGIDKLKSEQSMDSLFSETNDSDELCVDEKARLISQVLELQNTLDDLSQRVDCVKEMNLKLRAENQVLGQYIDNLMSASSVFQSTSPKPKK